MRQPFCHNVFSSKPYYPFGMIIPGRAFSTTSGYRFGFNSQEKDDEIAGAGNINTALYWEYDTRLGMRWNKDPKPNAFESEYTVFGGNPVIHVDKDGDTWFDKLVGETVAIVDNNTGGLVNLRGVYHPVNAHDYNQGQDVGDLTSIVQGSVEAGGGAAGLETSVIVTAGSGGTALIVSGPTAAASAAALLHGTLVGKTAAAALATKKGRVQEEHHTDYATKTAQDHHIATNKNNVSTKNGGPWSPRLRPFFENAGLNMDKGMENIMKELEGHSGPHPEAYHKEVFKRLAESVYGLKAKTPAYAKAVRTTLEQLNKEIRTPGSKLNKLVTK